MGRSILNPQSSFKNPSSERRKDMRSAMRVLLVAGLVLGLAVTGWAAESTLEKINRTGVFTVGARTGSPPFAYINKQNEWVGFSIDLARLVHKNIEKKLGKSIKFELKESAPRSEEHTSELQSRLHL